MTDAKHAAAPWSVCYHLSPITADKCKCGYRGRVWSADGETMVCELGPPRAGEGICCEHKPMPQDMRLATAALIAAAPDLLLACERALIPLTGGGEFFSAQDAIACINEALAKARGKS